ncbi:MAG TPA: hypothetical protein VJ486_02080 [Geothrix sp.]|nr:hypothetical protein [Geothrix sp.]
MQFRILPLCAAVALLPALVLGARTPKSRKHTAGVIRTAKEAKMIAEQDTGGKAISARRIALNGASGAWEVEVRMPHEDKGWRCIIDSDTRMVHTKTRIEQPGAKGSTHGSVQVVKGSQ